MPRLLLLLFLLVGGLYADTCAAPCIATTSTSSGASTAINTTGATVIVITCGHYAAGCVAPTSSPANTFTGLTNYARGTSNVSHWYKCGPTTSATQTFTPGQAGDTLVVSAYSGTATTSCFDTGQDQGTTASTTPVTTTITPSAASSGYLIISGISNCVNEIPTVSDDQGNTIAVANHLQNACVFENSWQAYRNYNSTSAINISWAIAADYAASATAGFKGSGGGPAGTPARRRRIIP